MTERPDQYAYPVEQVPVVVGKMRQAFAEGSYNKNRLAIQWTCRELEIAYTYQGDQ